MKIKSIRIQLLSLPILTLLMVLLASCAPAPIKPVAIPEVNTQVSSQVPQISSTEINPVETQQSSPTPMVTPRGPNLVSTDPSTVNLASGNLQLVEIFRFT